MMRRYTAPFGIRGTDYTKLLRYACERRMVALLVDVCGYSPEKRIPFLKAMEPHLISLSHESSWPGTRYQRKVPVYKYSLNEQACKTLLKFSTQISDWAQPELPEDFCLLRPDNSVFMTTTTSEQDLYFDITESEKIELSELIPDLKPEPEHPK